MFPFPYNKLNNLLPHEMYNVLTEQCLNNENERIICCSDIPKGSMIKVNRNDIAGKWRILKSRFEQYDKTFYISWMFI